MVTIVLTKAAVGLLGLPSGVDALTVGIAVAGVYWAADRCGWLW